MRPVIIVFARAPRPGYAKTRLTSTFTPAQAAALHTAFVCDTLQRIQTDTGADVELHTDIKTDAWSAFKVPTRLQHEGDLGLKMLHALTHALAEGRPAALITGSDSPDVPQAHLTHLLNAPSDIALGPTDDGGFFAIAARRTHPEMFRGVQWSIPETLAQTNRALENCGLSVSIGPSWYDIDTPDDLARLNGEAAPVSAAALSRIMRDRQQPSPVAINIEY